MGLMQIIINKLFPNRLTEEQMSGIMMDYRSCWEVTEIKYRQAGKFFNALITLMPDECTFCVETTSLAEEVREFFEASKIPYITKVQLGTGSAYPAAPKVFHIAFSEQNMRQFEEFAENFAMPEICDHIHIYKYNEVLLEWFDVFSNPLYISKKISEDSIKSFCEKIGCEYCDGSLPSWPGPG
jgi:hypothetical protein